MLTKSGIAAMKEDQLRQEVLIPILRAMDYRDVYEYHGGAGEQGKDIVCWRPDPLGSRSNLALVVKAGQVSGQAATTKGSAGEVHMQVRQCFGKDFLDSVTGEAQPVHECWVVSSKRITKEAEDSIKSSLKDGGLARNVRFVNGDKLWELVQTHLGPLTVLGQFLEGHKLLDGLSPHFSPDVHVTQEGVHLTLREKYPGAAEEAPMAGAFRLTIPDTPEGKATREAFERFRATGGAAEIPGAFVAVASLPPLLAELCGSEVPLTSVSIRSNPGDKVTPVRIELMRDAGAPVVLEYIELRATQVGEEEVTISNEHQRVPARVTLTLRLKEQRANVNITYSLPTYNANNVLFALRLRECFSGQYTARIIDLDTGITFLEAQHIEHSSATPPPPGLIDEIADLAEIQRRTKRAIVLPERDLTEQEMQTVARLRQILHEGRLTGTWSEAKLASTPEGARQVLAAFRCGAVQPLVREEEADDEHIFGTAIPLGVVRITLPCVRLVNEEVVRIALDKPASAETAIPIHLAPEGDNKAVYDFLDWLPGDLMPPVIETDEQVEAVLGLMKTREELAAVRISPYNWKWVILAVQNALQGFMVLALTRTNPAMLIKVNRSVPQELLEAYVRRKPGKDLSPKALKAYRTHHMLPSLSQEETDARLDLPVQLATYDLIDFRELYRRIQSDEYMKQFGYKTFKPEPKHTESIELLQELRNDASHFTPKVMRTDLAHIDLPHMVDACLDIIQYTLECGSILWHEDVLQADAAHLVRQVRQEVHALAAAYGAPLP